MIIKAEHLTYSIVVSRSKRVDIRAMFFRAGVDKRTRVTICGSSVLSFEDEDSTGIGIEAIFGMVRIVSGVNHEDNSN